jgi:hypothetical protein|tara:strand:- start:1675 stop:1848 length:174 start_codon:yes stop_codon:yes gene_type:complete
MFSYCPKIKRMCAFATQDKEILRCGLIGGSLKHCIVETMPECPKDMSKYQITKYLKT